MTSSGFHFNGLHFNGLVFNGLVFNGLVLAISVSIAPMARADKNATIRPKIASLGTAVVEQSFDSQIAPPWVPMKGEWKVIKGVLVGNELAADKHAAVLNFQKKNRNSVVRFSFKFEGSTRGLHFSMNHKGGHLFRVIIADSKLSLHLDKNKKDPQSKTLILATAKGAFKKGEWYTMQVEMLGNQVVAQTDNGLTVAGSHAKLDTEKPNYRFVMRGDSLSIDDLHIWDVQ